MKQPEGGAKINVSLMDKRRVFNGECCNIEWCCSAPSVPHSMTLDSCPVISGNICVVQSKVSL